jgi:hypothetical protein
MDSKSWDFLFWILLVFYVISFALPALHLRIIKSEETFYGFQAAIVGIYYYGLGVPAHLSTIGGLIHRLSMKHPTNLYQNWHRFSIVFAIIGTIFWQLLFINEGLSVGYYLWLITTIGMAVAYYNFRIEKSKEMLVENGALKNEGDA